MIVTDTSTLKQKSQPLYVGDLKKIRKVSEQLFQEIKNHPNAVGLSAIQIGIPLRIAIVYLGSGTQNPRRWTVIVNPSVESQSDEVQEAEEGCLSIPNTVLLVSRPWSVRVGYRDLKYKFYKEKFYGIDARIIQHEIDHMDGILMTDRGK